MGFSRTTPVKSGTRTLLTSLYHTYHRPEYLGIDPLCCVREFADPAQREVTGLLASALAYGRVEQILASIRRVLSIAGNDILSFTMETTLSAKRRALRGFRHRFNDGDDVALLLEAVRRCRSEHGSLEPLLHQGMDCGDMRHAAAFFVDTLNAHAAPSGSGACGALGFLIPSPHAGSACKRLNMYFRWLVRADDGIDMGVWKSIPTSALIVPLDVHVCRIARNLGILTRSTADWKAAEEVTAHLRELDPVDPVKFDFSMCRQGMVGART